MNTTPSLDQVHAFWITLWDYIQRFDLALNLEEMQQAMTSVNKTTKHPFWSDLNLTLWNLVKVPTAKKSLRFSRTKNIEASSTRDWLHASAGTVVDVPPILRKRFAPDQPAIVAAKRQYIRHTYDADDLQVLGHITKLFRGYADTPFERKHGTVPNPFFLTEIEEFIFEADGGVVAHDKNRFDKAIYEANSDNVFFVAGREGNVMVTVRKHLNSWQMRQAYPGDAFRGPNAYFFDVESLM